MTFKLRSGRDLADEARRAALEQVALIAEEAGRIPADHAKGPHQTRKAIKKMRALLRLARSADEAFHHRENARWRELAALLAGPRETAALVETVDRFIAEFPEAAEDLAPLRDRLAADLDALSGDFETLEAARRRAGEVCAEAADALQDFAAMSGAEFAAHLARGAKATWREAQRAAARAARSGQEEDFHRLRKAVKRHWAELGLLRDMWPEPVKARRVRVETLGERLGELNDIHVMESLLDSGRLDVPEEAAAHAHQLLARKRRKLARRALSQAGKLFAKRPRGLGRAMRAAQAGAAEPGETSARQRRAA